MRKDMIRVWPWYGLALLPVFTNAAERSTHLICTTIFNGYGLGLFGKVGPAAGLVLTIVIYSFQILFSRWWFTRFEFGPMEWIWKSLAYQRREPFRKKTGQMPDALPSPI